MVANVNRNDHARGWICFGPEHVVHFHEDNEKLVGVLLRNMKGEHHSESAKPAAAGYLFLEPSEPRAMLAELVVDGERISKRIV